MKVVLEIDDFGNLYGLYTDNIDLFSIGLVKNVNIASRIEFNEEIQSWEVKSLNGEVLHKNKNRDNAIQWEIIEFSLGGKYYEESTS